MDSAVECFRSYGVDYRTAGEDVRDRVSFTAGTAAEFAERLSAVGIADTVALSTCNRCEVFALADDGRFAALKAEYAKTFPAVRGAGATVELSGRAAVERLFRIAAGLESMIFGEYQILGQVKEAYLASLRAGRSAGVFDRIFRNAVSAAKKVRTRLDLGAVPPSVCRAGIEYVERAAGFAGRRVFVIGSGRTGTLAAKLAKAKGAESISVCNRSFERTLRLVESCGAVPVDYARRHEAIAAADIVVSATASPHTVVCADEVALDHPVTFLDLASPRDIDPGLARNPLARLVSIDDVGRLASGDRAERESLTAKAMAMISAAVDATARAAEGRR